MSSIASRRLVVLFGGVALLGLASGARADVYVWSGNGHGYELVGTVLAWEDARAAAAVAIWQGVPGHLATLTSAGEDAFVRGLLTVDNAWLGGYQLANQATPSVGWNWITGEPWAYTNWASGEPNDSGVPPYSTTGVEDNEENNLELFRPLDGNWNDASSVYYTDWIVQVYHGTGGYFVEYDTPPSETVPEPSAALLVLAGLGPIGVVYRRRLLK